MTYYTNFDLESGPSRQKLFSTIEVVATQTAEVGCLMISRSFSMFVCWFGTNFNSGSLEKASKVSDLSWLPSGDQGRLKFKDRLVEANLVFAGRSI